jgi:hypothetical protein
MRNPGATTVEVWAPGGEPVYDPATGDLVAPPDTLAETVRGHVGILTAEERSHRQVGTTENVEAYALLPLHSVATAGHYVKLPAAHRSIAGTWGIAGTEWRPSHLRLLLKRGFTSA